MARRWLNRSFLWLAVGGSFFAVAALLVHIFLRDRVYPLSILYYGTPLVLLAGLWLFCAVLWLLRGRRIRSVLCGVLAVACFAWWYSQSHESHPPAAATPDLTLLLWNIDRAPCDDPFIRGTIDRVDADVVTIVESGRPTRQRAKLFARTFPDYRQSDLEEQLLCMVSGELLRSEIVPLGPNGTCRRSDIRVGTTDLTVLIADLQAHPHRSRRRSLEILADVVADLDDRPLILMGDFNTPAESVWFDGIRKHMTHAFETAGNGYGETWPMPWPILALDHIWVNDRIETIACRHLPGEFLGHQPVVAEIRIGPPR